MLKIYPYMKYGIWVFDDQRTGLKEEAFVSGMSEIITEALHEYLNFGQNASKHSKGFELSFSDKPFAEAQVTLYWIGEGISCGGLTGNWYSCLIDGTPYSGWLCPSLMKYFVDAPHILYCSVAKLTEEVNPIWNTNGAETKTVISGSSTVS